MGTEADRIDRRDGRGRDQHHRSYPWPRRDARDAAAERRRQRGMGERRDALRLRRPAAKAARRAVRPGRRQADEGVVGTGVRHGQGGARGRGRRRHRRGRGRPRRRRGDGRIEGPARAARFEPARMPGRWKQRPGRRPIRLPVQHRPRRDRACRRRPAYRHRPPSRCTVGQHAHSKGGAQGRGEGGRP